MSKMSITIRVLWTAILAVTLSQSIDGYFGVELKNASPARHLDSLQRPDGPSFNKKLSRSTQLNYGSRSIYQKRNNRPTYQNQENKSTQLNHDSRSTQLNHDSRSTYHNRNNRPTQLNHDSRSTQLNHDSRSTQLNHDSRSTQLNHDSRSTYHNRNNRPTYQNRKNKSTQLNHSSRFPYPKKLTHHNQRISLTENKKRTNLVNKNLETRLSHPSEISRSMPINKRRKIFQRREYRRNLRNKYQKQADINRTRKLNIANRKRKPIHRNGVDRPIQNIVRKPSTSKNVQRPTVRPQLVKKDSRVMLFANTCHPDFLRLGNGCYYFSKSMETWQGAHFACRDMESSLAVVETTWEDVLLRRSMKMKTMTPLKRWLGGIYDWEQNEWVWGKTGETMKYKSFLTPQEGGSEGMRWTCTFASPRLYYHWSYMKCTERMHFICEAPFKRVPYAQTQMY